MVDFHKRTCPEIRYFWKFRWSDKIAGKYI